jgi:hypothetical protein
MYLLYVNRKESCIKASFLRYTLSSLRKPQAHAFQMSASGSAFKKIFQVSSFQEILPRINIFESGLTIEIIRARFRSFVQIVSETIVNSCSKLNAG